MKHVFILVTDMPSDCPAAQPFLNHGIDVIDVVGFVNNVLNRPAGQPIKLPVPGMCVKL